MRKSPAEQMGIVIGKTVIREDWRSSESILTGWKFFHRPKQKSVPVHGESYQADPRFRARCPPMLHGDLIVRDNHITLAGSNDDSPIFEFWHVEQPPELLAA